MKYYNGPLVGDERPRGGGKYNETAVGNEAYNFHKIGGQLFGYFQPQMQSSKIKLERIVAGATGDVLNGVLVIFIASDPERGGQRIVGWYRNATVYRDRKSSPKAERNGFYYLLVAEATEAVLLPSDLRTQIVPSGKGGFGQANICYVFEQDGDPKSTKWMSESLEFVRMYQNDNLLVNPQAEAAPSVIASVELEIERSAGFQPNSKIRKAVELHAMARATQELETRGYDVKDISKTRSYDLHCTKSNEVKYVEVKGTQTDGVVIGLTAGEVNFVKKHYPNSILCVVRGIAVTGKRRPKASGGKLSLETFDLSTGELKPVAFTFRRKF